jgi:hypothetical protein
LLLSVLFIWNLHSFLILASWFNNFSKLFWLCSITGKMNLEHVEWIRSWPVLRFYPNICLKEVRKDTKIWHYNTLPSGWKLNLGPSSLFHFSLLSRNESGLMKLPACLCVCVCVFPLITFEQIGGFSWNFVGRCCHSRWLRFHNFQSHIFNHFKVVEVRSCWKHDVQPCTGNVLGLFDCWVIIIVGSVWLLDNYYCWKCLIVGISLAKVTMATIAYCMGKRSTEDLYISFDPLDRLPWTLVWPRRHNIFINLVGSAIPKWRTFKPQRLV